MHGLAVGEFSLHAVCTVQKTAKLSAEWQTVSDGCGDWVHGLEMTTQFDPYHADARRRIIRSLHTRAAPRRHHTEHRTTSTGLQVSFCHSRPCVPVRVDPQVAR